MWRWNQAWNLIHQYKLFCYQHYWIWCHSAKAPRHLNNDRQQPNVSNSIDLTVDTMLKASRQRIALMESPESHENSTDWNLKWSKSRAMKVRFMIFTMITNMTGLLRNFFQKTHSLMVDIFANFHGSSRHNLHLTSSKIIPTNPVPL